jgi:hypothetical protein
MLVETLVLLFTYNNSTMGSINKNQPEVNEDNLNAGADRCSYWENIG